MKNASAWDELFSERVVQDRAIADQTIRIERIVHKIAVPLTADQTRLSQDSKVLRDCRLGNTQMVCQGIDTQWPSLANARFAIIQQLNQP